MKHEFNRGDVVVNFYTKEVFFVLNVDDVKEDLQIYGPISVLQSKVTMFSDCNQSKPTVITRYCAFFYRGVDYEQE